MQFDKDTLSQLAILSADWARRRSAVAMAVGDPLPNGLLRQFERFFPAATLAAVRVEWVEEIANPDFYQVLALRGLIIPHDLRHMAGLTLDRAILVSRSRASFEATAYASLLFHELVHVVQYELLGVDRFMSEYVRGWSEAGQDYYRIPLEIEAYGLQARFDASPNHPFSVRDLVTERLRVTDPTSSPGVSAGGTDGPAKGRVRPDGATDCPRVLVSPLLAGGLGDPQE
jgi:hypothetical protein